MTTPTDRNTGLAESGMFEELPQPSEAQVQQAQAKAASKRVQGAPRLLRPNRSQIELRASDLESLLAQDHRARLVWGYVVHQDLSAVAVRHAGRRGQRAATAECVNAQARNRGLLRMPVRGLAKAMRIGQSKCHSS